MLCLQVGFRNGVWGSEFIIRSIGIFIIESRIGIDGRVVRWGDDPPSVENVFGIIELSSPYHVVNGLRKRKVVARGMVGCHGYISRPCSAVFLEYKRDI